MRRLFAYGAALALALTLGPIVPGAPAPTAAANGKVLVKQTATLGGEHRASGMTPPSDPGLRLASARVDIEVAGSDYFVDASLTLAATPTAANEGARLVFGLGHHADGACNVRDVLTDRSDTYDTSYSVVGYTTDQPTMSHQLTRPAKPWSCVIVVVESSDGPILDTPVHDVLIAGLKNTYQAPKLVVGKVSFLGKNAKRLRLVRGVPTRIEVTVRNRGKVSAGRVRITGRGKGVKVGKVRSATALGPGRATTLSVPVRIRARKARKVRLVVRGGGVVARRVIVVRPVKAPPRPRAGRYRSPDGRVTFAVRKGRIVNWRGTMTTRCGIAPAPFTYTQNTYDFPRRRIPRNGIVQARARGAKYSTSLRLRIAGGKVTRGLFTYAGPGACAASVAFTARRVGR